MDWPTYNFYPLKKRSGFEDLQDRLIIDWSKAPLAWHQWFSDRPVIEIRPAGRVLPPFRDYLRVHLTFDDLVTGEQYVGSATGIGGLWQRWCGYAKSRHGGNLNLRELCGRGPADPTAILETFSRTLSGEEALDLEAFFKQKLGTRTFGLNAN